MQSKVTPQGEKPDNRVKRTGNNGTITRVLIVEMSRPNNQDEIALDRVMEAYMRALNKMVKVTAYLRKGG